MAYSSLEEFFYSNITPTSPDPSLIMVSYLVCATKSAIQNVGADLFANDNLKDEIVVKYEDSNSSDKVVKDLS